MDILLSNNRKTFLATKLKLCSRYMKKQGYPEPTVFGGAGEPPKKGAVLNYNLNGIYRMLLKVSLYDIKLQHSNFLFAGFQSMLSIS